MPHMRISVFKRKYDTFEHSLTEIFNRKFNERGLFNGKTDTWATTFGSKKSQKCRLNGAVKKTV